MDKVSNWVIDCAHFDGQSNQSHETIDVFFLTYQRSVMIDENVSSSKLSPGLLVPRMCMLYIIIESSKPEEEPLKLVKMILC